MTNRHLAIIFSDWHVHNYQRFNTGNTRLRHCINVLFDLAATARAKGVTTIFFAGDLYDTQKALLTEVVNETVDAFVRFSEEYPEITIYAISGNHDHSTKNLLGREAVSALTHIARVCHNFYVVDNTYAVIEGTRVHIHGVPYYEYKEHYTTKLKERSEEAARMQLEDPESIHILMLHQTPDGIGNTNIPADTNPKDELYAPFDHSFCGHIHIHQRMTIDFTLVGSPIHRDAADAGIPKGFLVKNLLDRDNKIKFVRLKNYPEFVNLAEGDTLPNEGDYPIITMNAVPDSLGESMGMEHFNTSLKDSELVENYWDKVDGKDKELLALGLSFVAVLDAD